MTRALILHYAPDNASLCVRLALNALEMPFETRLVDRSTAAQRTPAYLALNPNGLIPTLETPHGPMFETAAILLWLADQRAGEAFPNIDDPARGRALTRLFWLSNTLHPTLRRLFYPSQFAAGAEDILRTKCRDDLLAQFDMLEACNEGWLTAQTPSILACYLAPMLRWPALYGGANFVLQSDRHPILHDFAVRFENSAAMQLAINAEGLGPTPISAPLLPNPPEGSAT